MKNLETDIEELLNKNISKEDFYVGIELLLKKEKEKGFKPENESQIINNFLNEIIGLNTEEDIYRYTGEYLSNLFKDIIVVVNTNDIKNYTSTPLGIFFPDQSLINKALKFLNIKILGTVYPISPNVHKFYDSGTLNKVEGGLVEISKGYYPDFIMKGLVKMLGIKDAYLLGLKRNDTLFACLQFYTFNNSKSINTSFIETLCKQASLVIQKKHSENQVLAREKNYRELFDNSPNPISIFDIHGNVLIANKWQKDSEGIDVTEFIGKNISRFFPKVSENFFEKTKNVLQSKKTEIYEQSLNEKGETFWFSNRLSPLYNEEGTIDRLLLQSFDITEQKRAEIELTSREKKYASIFNTPFSAIFIYEEEGFIIETNLKAQQMFQYSQEEFIGMHISNITSRESDEKHFNNIRNAIKNDEVYQFESTDIRKDGSCFFTEVSITTFQAQNRRLVVAIVKDITESKNAKEKIEEKNRELHNSIAVQNKFFSIITHDLRGPLNSLIAFSDMLLEDIENNKLENIKRDTSLINKSLEHTTSLLTNLIEWSQSKIGFENIQKEMLDVSFYKTEIPHIFRGAIIAKNITIECVINNYTQVFADAKILKVILTNLFSNAVKYVFENGTISIHISNNEKETLFSVSDNGVGIHEKDLVNLFNIEKNFTTPGTNQELGTGLGLHLCKEFVEKQGGKIWVESKLNQGSTFYFTLPLNLN